MAYYVSPYTAGQLYAATATTEPFKIVATTSSLDYEKKISKLQMQVQEKNEEIAHLKRVLFDLGWCEGDLML